MIFNDCLHIPMILFKSHWWRFPHWNFQPSADDKTWRGPEGKWFPLLLNYPIQLLTTFPHVLFLAVLQRALSGVCGFHYRRNKYLSSKLTFLHIKLLKAHLFFAFNAFFTIRHKNCFMFWVFQTMLSSSIFKLQQNKSSLIIIQSSLIESCRCKTTCSELIALLSRRWHSETEREEETMNTQIAGKQLDKSSHVLRKL